MRPEDAMPKVKTAIAYGAAAADPATRAAALSIYGDVLAWNDHDWRGALVAFQRAYELSGVPSLGYGLTNSIVGEHDTAIAIFEQLLTKKNTQATDTLAVRNNLAWAFFNARRYVEAQQEAERVIATDASYADGYRVLGRALLLQNQHDAALQAFREAAILMQNPPVTTSDIAVSLARANRKNEARELLAELEAADDYVPAPLIAQIYANLGENDMAIEWLSAGQADGARGVVFLKINPLYDGVRDDPRFQEILNGLGLATAN